MFRIKNFVFGAAAFVGAAVMVTGTAQAGGQGGQLAPITQSNEKLSASQLKDMLVGLGHETKDLNTEVGKEKYQVTIVTEALNIPVGFEISPSGNYIWQTVSLGAAKPGLKYEDLIRQNGVVQPSFFYTTSKGTLMMAQAIDNRQVSPPVIKRCLDKISSDVAKTKAYWQTGS